MKLLISIAFFVFINLSVYAQYAEKVKADAELISKATMDGDFDTLLDHTYPRAIANNGGKELMLKQIKDEFMAMKQKGRSIKFVSIGEPGPVYRSGNELHCVVPQYMELFVEGGYISSNTSMLAISSDDGKTWTFISAGNIAPERFKQMFPYLNKNIKIIPSSTPVFHSSEE